MKGPPKPSVTLSKQLVSEFQRTILERFRTYDRPLPWRQRHDPYSVLVSEMMLQQTQVERILSAFPRFMDRFPNLQALADASTADVLREWVGLGYYRRAVALRDAARKVITDFNGIVPNTPEELITLPGIGPATAGAIAAFAYNRPVVFIETNIRRVFIHFFFGDKEPVHDRDILPLVESTLYRRAPRTWYYALTDYGVMLKKAVPNPNRRSAHYHRQSPYEGSVRQGRARILKALLETPSMSLTEALDISGGDRERLSRILNALVKEELIEYRDGVVRLKDDAESD